MYVRVYIYVCVNMSACLVCICISMLARMYIRIQIHSMLQIMMDYSFLEEVEHGEFVPTCVCADCVLKYDHHLLSN